MLELGGMTVCSLLCNTAIAFIPVGRNDLKSLFSVRVGNLQVRQHGCEMFKEAMSTNRSEVSGGHMIRLWRDTVGEMKVNVTVSDLSVLYESFLPKYSSIMKNHA